MQAPEIVVSVLTSLFELQHETFYAEDKNYGFCGQTPVAETILYWILRV